MKLKIFSFFHTILVLRLNFASPLVCLILTQTVFADALQVKTEVNPDLANDYNSIYQPKRSGSECFFAETTNEKNLVKICLENGNLIKQEETATESHVHSVIQNKEKIAVAYGMGRQNLGAPLKIVLFDQNLTKPITIFTHSGERSEAVLSEFTNDKIFMTYFDSKYITKTGELKKDGSANWNFNEILNSRLGNAVDVSGKLIVVGRPYGDVTGQDGDVTLYKDGKNILLPSYRGVRAVKFINLKGESLPSILIADGWHQNYGQFAQGRVSLLKEYGEENYSLRLLDWDKSQFGFSAFQEIFIANKQYILALGPSKILLYDPQKNWEKTPVYEQINPDRVLNFAYLGTDSNGAKIAVIDDQLKVLTISK